MISTRNVSLKYGGRKLFDDVNIKFMHGNPSTLMTGI